MTTKPKARRFHLEVPPPEKPAPKPAPEPAQGGNTDPADAVEKIKAENLTPRQLRIAARLADRKGMKPSSDHEAVLMLREAGIHPFKTDQRTDNKNPVQTLHGDAANLPSKVRKKAQMPSPRLVSEGDRATEIMRIQRDIVRRRRRRAGALVLRLLFLVLLPTAIAGVYFYRYATPMYSSQSQFVIQQADSGLGGRGGGSLFSGTSFATSQDAIAVQGYLQSRDAMLRLDEDEGFKAHFLQDRIDDLQRLPEDASNEDAYRLYKKHVRIGYDPTEGLIRMEVIAADPETAAQFSRQLIAYAEERVDQLTARLRADQMAGAEQGRAEANEKMFEAQRRIIDIQERLGVLNPESEIQAVFSQIATLESQLLEERLSLRGFLGNERPNEAKVSASRNKIVELESLIAEKRAQLTQNGEKQESLARISGELLVAQQDLQVRQELLAQASAQFEVARLQANRQTRYLSVGVRPVAPDEASYPRAWENTALTLLIFSGIYLMVSLTASILREQV